MTSKPVALLMADLGVTKTHSRPHVSDDNPYSESQFKTLKYRPEFPERFGSIEDARAFGQTFFAWYNHEHHHSGIALLTPEMLHYGMAGEVIEQRQQVLDAAYARNPERFTHARPKHPPQPTAVWINPPNTSHRDRGKSTLNSDATCLKLVDTLRFDVKKSINLSIWHELVDHLTILIGGIVHWVNVNTDTGYPVLRRPNIVADLIELTVVAIVIDLITYGLLEFCDFSC